MRVLCSTFGSSGDVFPMFGLALELRRRGHDVRFATNVHYAGLADRHGMPFEPLGTEAQFEAAISNPDLWHPRRAFAHVFRSFQPALRRQYEIHAEFAARGGDLAITNCFGFGAFNARDTLGLPVLTLHLQPSVLWSDHLQPRLPGLAGPPWLRSLLYRLGERLAVDSVVCPPLNAWRRELGLPPVRRITRWWNSPSGVIALFPAWFGPPQPDWPSPLIQTDFPLWNARSDEPLAAELSAFLGAGPRPLVFTAGSTNVHAAAFFGAAVEACDRLGRRGVLLTEFPDQLPRPLPTGVIHVRYVPLDRLLPQSAAFVHHGGIGSASQAMAAGVPQLIMPLAHDQFDNAARLARLGIGDELLPSHFKGPALARRLAALLDQPAVAAACHGIAGRLADRDGLARAAAALESRFNSEPAPDPRGG